MMYWFINELFDARYQYLFHKQNRSASVSYKIQKFQSLHDKQRLHLMKGNTEVLQETIFI